MVKGSISGCPSNILIPSDNIPVSECPINNDNDLANDNIDIDYDNDGITNCTESYGSQPINISNPILGTVATGTYSNSFTGTITNTSPAATVPFTGNTDGSFVTEVLAGKDKSVTYNLNFTKAINLSLEYPATANASDLLNSDSEYIINSDIDKTVTVLNPTNQLLIDTNYDGVYESGVTQFSSFEIRFRLNGNIPLPAGTGTFKFQSYQIKSFKITHKNLLDSAGNKSTFKLIATCIPKDSDGDGIPDQLDLDSDNDGIPDLVEAQKVPKALSNKDINQNGLDDMFEPISSTLDTDNDGIPDYLDLDSDNDGIYDLVESGSNASDTNLNGIIDGIAFGSNGLADSLEKTNPDSGILNYIVSDSDGDGIKNHTELDSDNDGCNDVLEAVFTDPNFDGLLGNIPLTVNSNGKVISPTATNGYTIPINNSYIISNAIIYAKRPENQSVCLFQNTSFTVESDADTFQWQLSIDGINWNNITNNATYSNVSTNTLSIKNATNAMNGYQYRVQLNKNNSACGLTPSNVANLTILALPVVNSPITIVQCDDDTDGISNFNLTEKNSFISANSANETFTYYTSSVGANAKDNATFISNPLAYTSADNNKIWTRVENANGCFSVAQLDLKVSTTKINNANFPISFSGCDDFIDASHDDKDGITAFDFSIAKNEIQKLLPIPNTDYTIKFYPNEADALAETNAIANPANYRNTTPNQQDIWARVDSNLENSCYGLGAYVTLKVNAKPNIDLNDNQNANRKVCSNLPNFFVQLDAGIIGNTPASAYNYVWSKDGSVIPGEIYDTLEVNEVGKYTVEVSNPVDNSCSRTRTITVTTSDIAHLDSVSISDLSEYNTVEAIVSGAGNYEFSIDLPSGPFQESNLLENIPAGIHNLYIHDKNGCGTASKTIAVLGIPKFFTPNNDGSNDYWYIKGTNKIFNSGAKIFIYDRFGKVIKQIIASSDGWDGTFIGNPMPADDYWYTVKLEDGREVKGHFALIR
jgi:gliding motility-associated-like protein